jgi:polysaccharide biosynthesis transport protein
MDFSEHSIVKPSFRGSFPLARPGKDEELTIRDLWNTLSRQKTILAYSLAVIIGSAILYCAFATRFYRATGEVQVQKEPADAVGLENVNSSNATESDALDANITLQTQAQVLQSDSLGLKVVTDLNLESSPDFRPKTNAIGWALSLISPAGPQDPKNASLEDSPSRRTRVLKTFSSKLEVKPVSGTRLIQVSYLSSDPNIAAQVVNHLIQGLIDYNFETRHSATQKVSGWLGNQLSDLRKQTEALQAKVVLLQHESGVFTLGQTDTQGREQVYTPVLDRLQQATTQLTQAQSARIMKGALYEVVKDGDPELISGLAGTSMLAAASPGVSGSMSLIQTLRAQEGVTQAQLSDLSAKFGPGYPKVSEVGASLESTRKAIQKEAERLAGRVKNDFDVASQVENNAHKIFLDEKRQADSLNDKAIEYEIVRQEAIQSRNLYETMLRRLKEADLLAGLKSTNITLVDPARVPSRPAKPNVLLFLAVSLASGLLVGTCGALFRDATNTKIQDPFELESLFGETTLGIIPYHEENRSRQGVKLNSANLSAALLESRAAYTEAVRSVRTSLTRVANGVPPKVILITSSVSGEGKSMLSSDLAILLAQQGKKVLLVDADLRTPALHRKFNLSTDNGLTSILTTESKEQREEHALSAAVTINGASGLEIITAGTVPKHPAELLASDRMEELVTIWRQKYDIIIIDGAPVLPVTDSVLLSTIADLTVVVARYRVTERQSLNRTCSILHSQGARRIGLVLNGIQRSESAYHTYYGYRTSSYYGVSKCIN